MSSSSYEKSPIPSNSGTFHTINILMAGLVKVAELGAQQQERAGKAEEDFAQMESLAMLDPLTGLHNRRALEGTFNKLRQPPRYDRSNDSSPSALDSKHSLLLIDIDHFKSVNDAIGHPEGDKTLQKVADVMKHRVRERDLLARIGGEEFAILLPRTDEKAARIAAEDIRELIKNNAGVTVSIGAGELDLYQPLDINMKPVDSALYAAKGQGRDRVVCVSEILSPK